MIYQETRPIKSPSGNFASLADPVNTWQESKAHLSIELSVPESPISDFVEKIQRLSELPINWDGNKARPILHESAVNTIKLFYELMFENSPIPDVVPTVQGNLQLEWHVHGIDLEIEIDDTGRISTLYEDAEQELDWSESFNYAVARLKPIIEALTLKELDSRTPIAA